MFNIKKVLKIVTKDVKIAKHQKIVDHQLSEIINSAISSKHQNLPLIII